MTHLRYPPPHGPLLVPTSTRTAFRSGLALWSATRRSARLLQRGYWLIGSALGPALLPFGGATWHPPLHPDVAASHHARWTEWFGPYDEVAVYRPAQSGRAGFAALLLHHGAARGFVKCRPRWDPTVEISAHTRLAEATTFTAPAVVGRHDVGEWTTVGMTALPGRIHRSRPVPVVEIAAEISQLIAIDRSEPAPAGWVPMHGDMGPWNLRWMPGLGAVLFDWEYAGMAPPGSDVVFHAAACRAVGMRKTADISPYADAREFWRDEIPRRFGRDRRDARLAGAMLAHLHE